MDVELQRAGLDPKLLAAAGHTVESLLDAETGLINRDALTAAIEATIVDFRIDIPGRPRRPDAVPELGVLDRGAPPRPSGSARFTSVFDPKS